MPSARTARQLSERAAPYGDGVYAPSKPPQEPSSQKPPAPHRRTILVGNGSKFTGGSQVNPRPQPTGAGEGDRLGADRGNKLKAYKALLQKEQAIANDLPDRTRKEPTVPLTARGDGKDATAMPGALKFNSWNNEKLAAAPAPLTQRNKHGQPTAMSGPATQRTPLESTTPTTEDGSRASTRLGGGVVESKTPAGLPMTPAAALRQYKSSMSLYEQGEILDYPQVYFVGPNARKQRNTASQADNNGFDDDRGDYLWQVHDHIGFRYEILGVLGKGSFGQVLKCFDWKTNQLTALKVIRNKKRFHQQALIEVKLLQQLKQRDADGSAAVVHVTDNFYFRAHMCITFEMLSINLYELIKNNKFQGLSLSLVRRIAVQLLHSLKFLRKQNIIHCDLKPENILLRSANKSAIKVIDFGSSCLVHERMYTYIQSRFYRAPEVILGLPYDTAIDMWSFACILAELLTGYPIFPGENEVEQLACQMEILGLPPASMINVASRRKLFFDSSGNPRIVPNSRGRRRQPGSKDLASVQRANDRQFVSFLQGCLQWDKSERFTPEQALKHPWIAVSEGGEGEVQRPEEDRLSRGLREREPLAAGLHAGSAAASVAGAPGGLKKLDLGKLGGGYKLGGWDKLGGGGASHRVGARGVYGASNVLPNINGGFNGKAGIPQSARGLR